MAKQDKLKIALGAKYSITETIGVGGMGTVYSAIDTDLERQVAVKAVLAEDKQTEERFLKEIKVLARLHHENIIPILDTGKFENLLYYVTPLIKGETLVHIL